jgi:hypothetical protein
VKLVVITSKSALTQAGKVGIVVAVILLVVGAAYLASPLLTKGGTSSTSSSTAAGSSTTTAPGSQTAGPLSLFGSFSQVRIWTATYDHGEGNMPSEQHNMTCVVLGKATLNSTQYVKVEFSQLESSGVVIAWFNPQGGVDRVDVLGVGNHTGSQASFYAEPYLSALTSIMTLTSNSTALPPLKQTSQGTLGIGPTQMSVTTYGLASPLDPFTNVTAKFATIPGTNLKIAVYVDVNTSDKMETTLQVTSLTK